jgi:hypothetical protein
MASDDKAVRPAESLVGGGEIRRGLDQLVTVSPPADAVSPQDAMAAAEPPPQDAKE